MEGKYFCGYCISSPAARSTPADPWQLLARSLKEMPKEESLSRPPFLDFFAKDSIIAQWQRENTELTV